MPQKLEQKLIEPNWTWTLPYAFIATDIVAVVLSMATCVYLRYVFGGEFELSMYWKLWPIIGLYTISFFSFGAYQASLPAPLELKKTTNAIVLVFLILAAYTFWSRTADSYSRLVLLSAHVLICFTVPLFRYALRKYYRTRPWWGFPTIIYKADALGIEVVRKMRHHSRLLLRPVAFLDNRERMKGRHIYGINIIGDLSEVEMLSKKHKHAYFIFAQSDSDGSIHHKHLELVNQHFGNTIIINRLLGLGNYWCQPFDVGGILGLRPTQKLLDKRRTYVKDIFDVLMATVFILLLSPVFLVLALLVKCSSKGPIIYRQIRIGKGGKAFTMYKFRTMAQNSEELVRELIKNDETARREWKANHKFNNDPRLTPIGRFLRKASLDELPQLFNVLQGNMSIVGPRPIVREEIAKYGNNFALYARTKPGLTGLWQVSGRSRLSFKKRVELDLYYTRNWSIWMDLIILAKTPWAICQIHNTS